MRCHYCGKENDGDSARCNGCGTWLSPAEGIQKGKTADNCPAPVVPQLDARRATKILAIACGASVLGGLAFAALGAVLFEIQGQDLREEEHTHRFTRVIVHPIGAVMTLVAGVAMVWATRSLPREVLKDGSALGAAWVVGPKKQIVQALGLGALMGLAFTVLAEH